MRFRFVQKDHLWEHWFS